MKIILTGQTPSQKNAKQIAINRNTGKRFPMTAPEVKLWQRGALLEAQVAKNKIKEEITSKVYANYMFYVKDNRRRDLDNMIASCNDVLVKAGILPDDNWCCLGISGADAEVDAKNPRVEIHIEE